VDRRFLRPGWIAGHLLVLAAVLTCLRLGWWQWQRTQETTGTAQNFGYAVLWPAFGAAFIFMWVRFLHLEVLKDAEDDEETDRDIRALLDEHDLADGADPHTAGSAEPVNAGPTSAGAALPGRDDSLDGETGPADQGAEATDDAAKEVEYSEADIDRSLSRLRSSFASEQEYESRMRHAGRNEQDVRAMVSSQLYLSNYLDSRFPADLDRAASRPETGANDDPGAQCRDDPPPSPRRPGHELPEASLPSSECGQVHSSQWAESEA